MSVLYECSFEVEITFFPVCTSNAYVYPPGKHSLYNFTSLLVTLSEKNIYTNNKRPLQETMLLSMTTSSPGITADLIDLEIISEIS
jgi:hypothetical protein